jgi:hypothetical protein
MTGKTLPPFTAALFVLSVGAMVAATDEGTITPLGALLGRHRQLRGNGRNGRPHHRPDVRRPGRAEVKKPTEISVKGRRYKAVVFLVNTKGPGGPMNCTRIPEDHKVELSGGEEFIVGYFPSDVIKD